MTPCLCFNSCCSIDHPLWMLIVACVTIILVTGSILCYLNNKNKIQNEKADKEREHEKTMRNLTFDNEKKWAILKDVSADTVEALKKEVEGIKQNVSDLKAKLISEEEKNKLSGQLLSTYEDILKKLNVKVLPDDNTEKKTE